MARTKLSEQEWQTFLSLADRLGIPGRELREQKVRFTELESARHRPWVVVRLPALESRL